MGLNRLAKNIAKDFRTKGAKVAFQHFICDIIGVQEQLDTLQYLMNHLHEASDCGKTKNPDLRIMQLCDAVLLAIFDKFCKKHHLSYWLDYGTLLGARRHGGFIPWDDDMDVAMPREDYQKAMILMESELKPLGLNIEEIEVGRLMGLSYQHHETGIWLDIFPVDTIETEKKLYELRPILDSRINKYRKYWNRHKKTHDAVFFNSKRHEMINEKISKGDEKLLYHTPEFKYIKNLIHEYNSVFPLKKRKFEDFELNVPYDIDSYLIGIYGSNYMGFPAKGILKHDLGRGALSSWALKNGVNMYIVKEKLESILKII